MSASNYDQSMKVVLFLLHSKCSISLEKMPRFVRDITDGALSSAIGMTAGLYREFSLKSRQEPDELFVALLDAPVLYVDGTGGAKTANSESSRLHISAFYDIIFHAKKTSGPK